VVVVAATQAQQVTPVVLAVAVADRAVLVVLATHLQPHQVRAIVVAQVHQIMLAAAVEHPSQATPMERHRVAMELHPQSRGHR
jgi:hypothetical protein